MPVNSGDIEQLFGTDVNFTLERFIQITSNKTDLIRYYNYFKKIKEILLVRSKGNRTYMPTTFDETMVDFGFRLSHKHYQLELKLCLQKLERAIMEDRKVEEHCWQVCKIFEQIINNHDPEKKSLPSHTN